MGHPSVTRDIAICCTMVRCAVDADMRQAEAVPRREERLERVWQAAGRLSAGHAPGRDRIGTDGAYVLRADQFPPTRQT
jgi:hypothetical protein